MISINSAQSVTRRLFTQSSKYKFTQSRLSITEVNSVWVNNAANEFLGRHWSTPQNIGEHKGEHLEDRLSTFKGASNGLFITFRKLELENEPFD